MTLNGESLYCQIGRLLEEMPTDWGGTHLTEDHHRWLGRADALITQTGDMRDSTEFRIGAGLLDKMAWPTGLEQIKRVLYCVLAAAELKAPAAARGSYIPVGSSFDAFAA